MINPLIFFSDPVFRAPTIGSMLMCLAAGIVGSLVFLRKQSLLGEALSHAAYPGVILGVLMAGVLGLQNTQEGWLSLFILIGASITALLGLWLIHFLEKRFRVQSDAALCFVLAIFFGVGITLASEMQFSFTALYQRAQLYLYGQAATMTDVHIFIYGMLAFFIIVIVTLFYKELQVMTFDRSYAKSLGIQTRSIESLLFVLIVLAVIIGIRSVGVVLMSAMLIAPPVAARQYTNRLSVLFTLSAVFGVISAFLGNYLSVVMSDIAHIALPTGPMIVLVATAFCIFALLFAPERGLLIRLWRVALFRYNTLCENVLKTMWRINPQGIVNIEQIAYYQSVSRLYLYFILNRMISNGWVKGMGNHEYRLTPDGQHRAAKIVRLHRLWEVYLADYVGVGVERVHRNAEEMEHIITPDLEQQLILLLNDPKQDPHHQPIPPKEETDAY